MSRSTWFGQIVALGVLAVSVSSHAEPLVSEVQEKAQREMDAYLLGLRSPTGEPLVTRHAIKRYAKSGRIGMRSPLAAIHPKLYRWTGNGLVLLGQANQQITGSLQEVVEGVAGADDSGRVRMFAPPVIELGSSVSHWDVSASPDLLMEPSISSDLVPNALDITPGMMFDMGWSAGTSSMVLINGDDPGEGLNDETPFTPIPSNPATTLGEARQNLLASIVGVWGSTLDSDIDIRVQIEFGPQFCEMGSATLASAGPGNFFTDLGGNNFFPVALIEAMDSVNINADDPDIFVTVNSAIDEACLGPGTSYSYATDGSTEPGQINLGVTLLHELGHGLGFTSLTNLRAPEQPGDPPIGAFLGAPIAAIFDTLLRDNVLDATWDQLNDAQRAASAVSNGALVWDGTNANDQAALILDEALGVRLTVSSPAELAGTISVNASQFGPAFTDTAITGDLVCLDDRLGVDPFDGCSASQLDLTNQIALIRRGGCSFVEKVEAAEAAGALAAVIVNNEPGVVIPAGTSSTTIPSGAISQSEGEALFEVGCEGVFFDEFEL